MSPGGQICSRKDSNLGHLMVVLEYVKEGIDFKLLTIFLEILQIFLLIKSPIWE